MMASVALAFAVLDITDSATALGQVLAAHTIPMVLFLLWGGVIADRFPRALVLQVSNVASGLTQGAIALLVITGAAELWMVIVLSAANGVVSAMSFPAMASLMPQLVPRDQLQQANALMSLVRGGLTSSGRRSVRCSSSRSGAGWALFVDALTWFAAAALLLGVRIPPPARPATTPRPGRSPSSGTAGRTSGGRRGCGSSCWPSASSTRSRPAPSSPSARPSPRTRSASRAGVSRCRPSPSGWC